MREDSACLGYALPRQHGISVKMCVESPRYTSLTPIILFYYPKLHLSSSLRDIAPSKQEARIHGILRVRSLGIHDQNSSPSRMLLPETTWLRMRLSIPHSLKPDKARKVQRGCFLGKNTNSGTSFRRERQWHWLYPSLKDFSGLEDPFRHMIEHIRLRGTEVWALEAF